MRSGDRALAFREAKLRFAWPISGKVSSRFGWRSGSKHEGIDIPAKKGTPIRAAEAGRVIHSGELSAYGYVVIVKHAGRYSTVYAHNRKNKVRKGQFVEQGTALQIFQAPTHPYTQGLLDCIPIPGKTARGARLGSIPGIVPSLVGRMPGCHFAERCRYVTDACRADDIALRDATEPGHRYRCVLSPEESAVHNKMETAQ